MSTDLNASLATHSRWPAMAQVGRLTRRVTTAATGLTREQTVSRITTRSPAPRRPVPGAGSPCRAATGPVREEIAVGGELDSAVGRSVLEHFAALDDPRVARAQRHSLLAVVAIACAG